MAANAIRTPDFLPVVRAAAVRNIRGKNYVGSVQTSYVQLSACCDYGRRYRPWQDVGLGNIYQRRCCYNGGQRREQIGVVGTRARCK